MSIPKVIHCIWVGDKPLPPLHKKCIDSWKKHLPEYQIKVWNEKNFPIHSIRFCAEAYHAKKYAFVSDYIRMYALYHEGGIYMDTDVEVLRAFTPEMLQSDGFACYETDQSLCTAILASAPGQKLFGQMLSYYEHTSFINEDGTQNDMPNVQKFTSIAIENGFRPNGTLSSVAGLTIYPQAYFSPLSLYSDEPRICTDTYTIHHFSGTWCDRQTRFVSIWNHGIKGKVTKIVGGRIAGIVYWIVYNLCRLLDHFTG